MGVVEQNRAEWSILQLGQVAQAAVECPDRHDTARIYPGLVETEQGGFPDQRDLAEWNAQVARFLYTGALPALGQHLNPEISIAGMDKACCQGALIKQPGTVFRP